MKKLKNLKYFIITIISILTFLLVWWLIIDVFELIEKTQLPSMIDVAKTFFIKFYDHKPDGATLPQHFISSLRIAVTGIGIGATVGFILGICMAWFRKADMFIRPLFDLVRPIPPIGWIPIMLILFGIGVLSKALVISLAAFIPCVINAYTGIKQTRAVHLWVGQTFGASNMQLLFKIAIPSSLPLIFNGFRVALGMGWGALVAAELLASNRGLGFMIQQARGIFRPEIIVIGMLVIGAVGALFTYIVFLVERKVLKGGKW